MPRSVGVVAAAVSVVLVVLSVRYGWHRDELYFVVAGGRPALGYVDQPPLTPLVARALYDLGGGSIVIVRLLPAVLAGCVVLLMARVASLLGGSRRAQLAAAVAGASMPVLWNFGHLLSTATLDVVFWLLVLVAILRRLSGGSSWWWVAAGGAAGVGMQNKHTVALLAVGLVAGFLLSGRRHARDPRLWLGLAVAAVIAAPNIVWQATNGWPQLEMAASLRDEHGGVGGGALAIALFALTVNPVLLPTAWRGWKRLWSSGDLLRPLAVAAPVSAGLQLLSGGQFYYVVPWAMVLIAAGMVGRVDEPSPESRQTGREWSSGLLRPAVVMVLLAPTVVPVLPPAVAASVGVTELNETLADQVGWPQLVATVREARRQVRDGRQEEDVVVLTVNYGEAAALELAGVAEVASGHNSYWTWGPPAETTSMTVLTVGYLPEWLEGWCRAPRELAVVEIPFGVDNEEDGRPVLACERAGPWSQVWPEVRHFN